MHCNDLNLELRKTEKHFSLVAAQLNISKNRVPGKIQNIMAI